MHGVSPWCWSVKNTWNAPFSLVTMTSWRGSPPAAERNKEIIRWLNEWYYAYFQSFSADSGPWVKSGSMYSAILCVLGQQPCWYWLYKPSVVLEVQLMTILTAPQIHSLLHQEGSYLQEKCVKILQNSPHLAWADFTPLNSKWFLGLWHLNTELLVSVCKCTNLGGGSSFFNHSEFQLIVYQEQQNPGRRTEGQAAARYGFCALPSCPLL